MTSLRKLTPVEAMQRDAERATTNWERAMAIKNHWGTSFDEQVFSVSNCLMMMRLFEDSAYKVWCIHTFIECAFYANQWLALSTAEAVQIVKEVGERWQAPAAMLALNHGHHELLDAKKVIALVSEMHDSRQRVAFAVYAYYRIRSVVAQELEKFPDLLKQLLRALRLGLGPEDRWHAALNDYEAQLPFLQPPWKDMLGYLEMSRSPDRRRR